LTFKRGLAKLEKDHFSEEIMINTYMLILQSGPDQGKEYQLEKNELYLGRDANNDVVINDAEVSRRHARLVKQGDDYFYEDLGSTNGSFILGQRLSTLTLLRPGATITIGERVVISYVMMSTDPNATVAAPRKKAQAVEVPPAFVAPPPPVALPSVQVPPATPVQPSAKMPEGKKKSKATMIILIIIAVILVFCIIPWIILEITASYCNFFPGIFNLLSAGSCS
jgi:pSer/pThr/pTyr-binding forkhead associated (FHA) protein